jgi:hypothetical protein
MFAVALLINEIFPYTVKQPNLGGEISNTIHILFCITTLSVTTGTLFVVEYQETFFDQNIGLPMLGGGGTGQPNGGQS